MTAFTAAAGPRECATTSLQHVEQGGEVALVFGREYAGLTNDELQRLLSSMCIFRRT